MIYINAGAQEKFETVWERAGDDRPEWFSDGTADENSWNGTERGIAYNPITEHVYVASRFQGEPHVRIVDPLTGEDVGELMTMGIEEGGDISGLGYPINNVQVSADGQIFACNLTLGTGNETTTGEIKAFRVYKWEFEGAPPEMIIDYKEGGYRLGDKFTVHGDFTSEALIYAGNNESSRVLQWVVENGIVTNKDDPNFIIAQDVVNLGTSITVEPLGTSPDDDMYISGKGFLPTLFNADGTFVSQFALSTEGAPSRIAGRMMEFGDKTYMGMYQGGEGYQNAVLIDMTKGGENVTDEDIYGMTSNLGTPSAWGEGAVGLANINDSLYVYVCSPDNGIGAYKATEIENVTSVEEVTANTYKLHNYPNPFKGSTQIEYTIPAATKGMVTLRVFDASGRVIKSYTQEGQTGQKSLYFNGEDLPGGVYYYRLNAGAETATRKMILLK